MTMKLSPGCNCCGGDSPCCCCFQSINVHFKKDGVTIKTIEVPIESLVFEDITIGGGPGTRCTYTTSHLTTCPSGRVESGYVDYIPIMQRTFNSTYCETAAPNILFFDGVERWTTNYVIRSITIVLTCSATQKRLSMTIDGFYELFKYAESGTYTVKRASDCALLFSDTFTTFDFPVAACSPSSTPDVCIDPDRIEVRNPYLFFIVKREQDYQTDTDLITATCQELVDDFESRTRWLQEYSSDTNNLENCSMPISMRDTSTVTCGCGDTANNYLIDFRANVDIEDEIVLIQPEITLC